jgi:hypothetical protein
VRQAVDGWVGEADDSDSAVDSVVGLRHSWHRFLGGQRQGMATARLAVQYVEVLFPPNP